MSDLLEKLAHAIAAKWNEVPAGTPVTVIAEAALSALVGWAPDNPNSEYSNGLWSRDNIESFVRDALYYRGDPSIERLAPSERFKIGDILECDGLRYQIVEVMDKGYSWKYPDDGERCANGQENLFWSENSTDPFFEVGWRRVG